MVCKWCSNTFSRKKQQGSKEYCNDECQRLNVGYVSVNKTRAKRNQELISKQKYLSVLKARKLKRCKFCSVLTDVLNNNGFCSLMCERQNIRYKQFNNILLKKGIKPISIDKFQILYFKVKYKNETHPVRRKIRKVEAIGQLNSKSESTISNRLYKIMKTK